MTEPHAPRRRDTLAAVIAVLLLLALLSLAFRSNQTQQAAQDDQNLGAVTITCAGQCDGGGPLLWSDPDRTTILGRVSDGSRALAVETATRDGVTLYRVVLADQEIEGWVSEMMITR